MGDTVFVHMELQGSAERVLGFVDGVRIGAGIDALWFHSEEGYALNSVTDSIKEKMGLETHVVLPLKLAQLIQERLEQSRVVKASVSWIKEIDYAELEFDFRCFSRDVGGRVREVIENDLPEGVRTESYEVDEQIADDAKGVELYTQMHDYTLSGSGRYVGRVPGVFELAQRLHDQDFISPGKVQLHFRP